MKSLQGQLLVASPYCRHPEFSRTVVLLLEHGEEGAVGIVLNRPGTQAIQCLGSTLGGGQAGVQRSLNFGGPVSGPLVALHQQESLAQLRFAPDLYAAWQPGQLVKLVQSVGHPLRLFVGYASWSRGQLESELRKGAWMVTPATSAHVFGDQRGLWASAVRQVGRSVLLSAVPSRLIPPNPLVN